MIPAARRRPETPPGPSLSPSRAADFKTCPLLFRFRTIDKLPETPSADQVRGTLVHAVLERLFDLPPVERTPEAAAALVAPEWERLLQQEPALAGLFTEPTSAPTAVLAPDPAALAAEADATGLPQPATNPHADGQAATRDALAANRPQQPDPAPQPAAAPDDKQQLRPAPGPTTAADTQQHLYPAADAPDPTADGNGLQQPAPAIPAARADATGQLALVDVPGGAEVARIAAFLASARNLLTGYFAVEDPQRLQPAERETLISTVIGDELLLRGYIDRLDVSPAGDMRVVDYKTGGAPREAFEGRALFQLKFYALVLWRTRGVVPRVLRLLYLKDAEVCDYSPEAGELERFERTLVALSEAIERAKRDRDFRPKPSRLCGWCSHQALCPQFGGTPPPFPELAPTGAFTAEPEPDRLASMLRDGPLG
ncbi:PD-(D/E)XK nuclease family protein [Actinoplanes sp. NEAU-A11]|uniref:PD-(D/E)XK nuclease family protein n=1 Tax=Actinoplanes aureus TaxID=2792083 RepID=A0A931G130_9ACTN|nr:PD-(D/E)XK nuclease family protein [Actinoplanes aureus]